MHSGQNTLSLSSLFFRFELILSYAADRTGPIVRQVFEGNIVVFSRIIDMAANGTDVFFHRHFSARTAGAALPPLT